MNEPPGHTVMDSDDLTARLQGSLLPEYRMGADQIREHDSLEELQDSYTDHGVELDGIEETYERAKEDWWEDTRQQIGRTDERLPGDTVQLRYEEDGEQRSAEVHVRGIVHGMAGVMNVSEQLEDETRAYIEERARDDIPVLLEENFEDALYDGIQYLPEVQEMGDHAVLTEHSLHPAYTAVKERLKEQAEEYADDVDAPSSGSREMDPRDTRLSTLGEVYKTVTKVAGRISQRPMAQKQAASMRAMDDPGYLRDMQDALRAGELPHHLKQDYIQHQLDTNREDQLEALAGLGEADGVRDALGTVYGDILAPEASNRFMELWELVEWGRSEYMAEEAVRALGAEDADEVDLVVGAGHQAQIVEAMEEMSSERFHELLDG